MTSSIYGKQSPVADEPSTAKLAPEVVCSSRMLPPQHWLVRRPEDPGDLVVVRQPGGRAADAEKLPALARRGFSYAAFARERDPRLDPRPHRRRARADRDRAGRRGRGAPRRASAARSVWAVDARHQPGAHRQLLIAELEAPARGEIKRLMFFLLAGAAKRTGSVLFPSWCMGNHLSRLVIAASHSEKLAERFGRRVRNVVRDYGPKLAPELAPKLAPDGSGAGKTKRDVSG
jgi:hypothetical protein